MKALQSFLAARQVHKDANKVPVGPHTHTSLTPPRSYFVADADTGEFMALYIASLGSPLHLTEKPIKTALPLLVDLDLRWPTSERRYTPEFVADFVGCYSRIARQYLALPDAAEWFVLEKPAPRPNTKLPGTWKDGVHLMCPQVAADHAVQKEIRAQFLKAHPAFFASVSSSSKEEVYDPVVLGSNNWLMYGSKKGCEANPWRATHVLAVDGAAARREAPLPDAAALVELLSIRNKAQQVAPLTDTGARLQAKRCTTKQATVLRESAACGASLPASFAQADPVVKLLSLLNKTRWDDRAQWRDVATALRNEHGERYRSEWERLSRASAKYDAAEADLLWRSVARPDYEGPRVRLATLYAWARDDDPLGYAELRASTIPPVVFDNWEKLDRGLAVIAHHLLRDHIKCVGSSATRSLYYFDEEECRWREGSEGSLHRRMTRALEETLRDLEAYYGAKARSEPNDDALRRQWDEKRRAVGERLRYVWKHGGISNVTKETIPFCEDDEFERRLDSHAHLLGVANGVVDLRTGRLRQREPEDMVFTVLDVAFDPQADTADMDRMVLDCMAGDAEMAAFLQRLLGYGVTGETREEVFPVFTGSGRNGKGGLTQTVAKVMGKFYRAMNSGLICERQVSNVDAERGKLLGARLAVFDELKAGERLKTHEVQLLSGGDGIPARPLYKNPITIMPRHLCILSTNHMPELNDVIPAIMERLLCVQFPVTFTDLLPGEAPSESRRQADHGLKRRLEENLPGVLLWLVRGAMAWYAQPGLRRTAPAKVTEFSRRYFAEQDRLGTFLEESCDLGMELRVPSVKLLAAFNEANPGSKMCDKTLASAMATKGFNRARARVPGYQGTCYMGIGFKEGAGASDDEV